MEEQKSFLEEDELILQPATPGVRFANYVIDILVYYAILFVIGVMGILPMTREDTFLLYVYVFGVLIAYYTILEGATGGKTLGKLVTGTRAVKDDGSRITFGDAFMRSLCRCVPFEPFTAFGGYPWHDRWTKTRVVKG